MKLRMRFLTGVLAALLAFAGVACESNPTGELEDVSPEAEPTGEDEEATEAS